jgi:hypothetical protein
VQFVTVAAAATASMRCHRTTDAHALALSNFVLQIALPWVSVDSSCKLLVCSVQSCECFEEVHVSDAETRLAACAGIEIALKFERTIAMQHTTIDNSNRNTSTTRVVHCVCALYCVTCVSISACNTCTCIVLYCVHTSGVAAVAQAIVSAPLLPCTYRAVEHSYVRVSVLIRVTSNQVPYAAIA